jgi:environmental stress-induced protein Ves
LSLADIKEDGDFSAYPGYRRALVLIAGKSLYLRFKGHGHCFLQTVGRGTRFEGDWKTHCTVPDGHCKDLSLIVRRGSTARAASAVRAPLLVRLNSTRRVIISRDLHAAIFVLDRPVSITDPTSTRPRTVRARDTLLVSPGPERTLTLRSLARPTPAQVIVLQWRPGVPHRKSSLPKP